MTSGKMGKKRGNLGDEIWKKDCIFAKRKTRLTTHTQNTGIKTIK